MSGYYGLTFQTAVDREPRPVTMYRVDPTNGTAPRRAVEVLRGGGLVVLPTDRGYVVACNALHAPAVARLRALTGVAYDALLWFAATPEQAAQLAVAPQPLHHPVALALMEAAGVPLAAAPARAGGRPAPSAQHVVFVVGDAVDLVLDAGPIVRDLAASR
ncbi:MAG: Sua5/YciO/YrdC/YwlC family protein [Armatimonadota bacterium]|nr:Sua5/YciO/YrdC/YwlC family protein [Armatimonadota bacterium]MDR7511710.1 Sua5/YciO/YrdC/YwlC family protein [Armatimonadota bacterium]